MKIPESILKISWWEKLALLFVPKQISSDIGQDGNCSIVFKRLRGKMYILEEKFDY